LAKIGFANLYHDSPLCTWGVQFLTTVHDAVVLLVPNHVVKKDLEQILHTHMEIKKPDFSLSVSLSVGNSWGEVQSI
jgi:DNA polymerase I-like protein with 3'-5' exonuclease and polymerase domains